MTMNGNAAMTKTAARDDGMATIERVLIEGDLSVLSAEQRVTYYNRTCESLGLNPLTRPFDYLKLNGKTVLYAKRDCTDQLRKIHRVSITIVSRERVEDCFVVTSRASMPDGRCDESTGSVSIAGLKGEAFSNAIMKSESKSKRRVTLSIVGLGILDESEVDSIKGAARVVTADGEVIEPVRTQALEPGEPPAMMERAAPGDEESERIAANLAERLESATASDELAGVVGDIVRAQQTKLITKPQRDSLTEAYKRAQKRVTGI